MSKGDKLFDRFLKGAAVLGVLGVILIFLLFAIDNIKLTVISGIFILIAYFLGCLVDKALNRGWGL